MTLSGLLQSMLTRCAAAGAGPDEEIKTGVTMATAAAPRSLYIGTIYIDTMYQLGRLGIQPQVRRPDAKLKPQLGEPAGAADSPDGGGTDRLGVHSPRGDNSEARA